MIEIALIAIIASEFSPQRHGDSKIFIIQDGHYSPLLQKNSAK
jgi:hypothetical protein